MHIFISYAKADAREIARKIFTRLNTLEGVSAWMDTSLVPAESWAQQIQEELNRSDLVLVIITPDVNRPKSERQSSSFVLKEINYAQSLHKPVLPVMGNYTHLPVQIADLEYIDFSNSIEDGMNRLVEYILNITDSDLEAQSTSPAPTLESWEEITIDSSTRRIASAPDILPPLPDWVPPQPHGPRPQRQRKTGNPLLGLLSGVMGGCVIGGIALAAAIVALYFLVLSDDNEALSDADATATAEVELTESVTVTATDTPTRTSVPLASDTPRPFVPSRTPTNTHRPIVPTDTVVVPTNTVVIPTPTFVPTNTYIAPTNTWVFVTQPPAFSTIPPPSFPSN